MCKCIITGEGTLDDIIDFIIKHKTCNYCTLKEKKEEEFEKLNNTNKNIINNNINLNIIGWNLFEGGCEDQIKYINTQNFDILFLTECSLDFADKLINYHGLTDKSHCKYSYLGINNKLVYDIKMIINVCGIIICHIIINDIEMVIGTIHLAPTKKNIETRKEQIKIIKNVIDEYKLENIPIILGGDTNIRYDEDDEFIKNDYFKDIYKHYNNTEHEITYPNKNFTPEMDSRLKFIPNTTFRYDRFYIKNIYNFNKLNTIPNKNSDHLAITTNIQIIKNNI
jgi:hypothetical protein